MPIRSNSYYNDPAFAQAASNIASLFAPPSGADAAGWATANAKTAEAKRLAELYAYANDPAFNQSTFDRRNIAVGNYNPTQSYYAQDQNTATSRRGQDIGAATARRGQDVSAATSRANNADTVRGSLIGRLYGPLNEGQTRPELPGDIAGMYGLSAVPAISGTPKPLSNDQWLASQNDRLLNSGQITDDMLVDALVGKQTPVQAVGADNKGVFMSPGAAVRAGAQPYDKPAATNLEGDNYLAVGPDGKERRFVGRPDAQGRVIDVNTGQIVPNVIRKEGTGGGMSVEVGKDGTFRMMTGNGAGQTNSRVTDLQRQEAEAGRAVNELTSLFNTLRPDDLGVAGNINEALTNYGAQAFPSVARPDVTGTRSQLNATTLSLAKALMGDERLSDADRRAANEVMVSGGLGESLPGAQAKLATLITLNSYRQKYANAVRTGGGPLPPLDGKMLGRLVDEGAISPQIAHVYAQNVLSRGPQAANSMVPGVNIPTAVPPLAGASATSLPTVRTPEEAAALPPGTRFRTPDGREKVRP